MVAPNPQAQQQRSLETGTTTPAPKPNENADKGKEKKQNAFKDMIANIGFGLPEMIESGSKSYLRFIAALEKLGAVDILDMLKKGFSVAQIEAEIKKQMEGKLISSGDIANLKTDTDLMTSTEAGEKDGDYVLRCLGLKEKYKLIPKRDDGKENNPTNVSMIWLKISGVMYKQAFSSIKDGFKADPESKKPILYENDLVYMEMGDKQYIAGFVKDIDFENDKIKLSTVENGKVVIKELPLKNACMAFHLAKNTKIMPKSVENLEKDKKDEKPADSQSGNKPAGTPGTPPAATT